MKFDIRISRVFAENLPGSKDKSVKPYIKIDFDSFKKYKSKSASASASSTTASSSSSTDAAVVFHFPVDLVFKYDTAYPQKLHRKVVRFSVYDHNVILSDTHLASVSVDLHTLASGPKEHDLQMWSLDTVRPGASGGKPAGRIKFSIEMVQYARVGVVYKDIVLKGISDAAQIDGAGKFHPQLYMKLRYGGAGVDRDEDGLEVAGSDSDEKRREKDKEKEATFTSVKLSPLEFADESRPPKWDVSEVAYFFGNLTQFFSHSLELKLYVKNLTKKSRGSWQSYGSAYLPIKSYHSFHDRELLPFSNVPIQANDDWKDIIPTGTFQVDGKVYFENFPAYVQMIAGVHTENGIVDGVPFSNRGVMLPSSLLISSSADKKGVVQTDPRGGAALSPTDDDVAEFDENRPYDEDEGGNEMIAPTPGHAVRKSSGNLAPVAAQLAAMSVSPVANGQRRSLGGTPSNHRASISQSDRPVSPQPSPPANAQHARASSASTPSTRNANVKPGSTGFCVVCDKPSEYVCKQTKVSVCSRECKLIYLRANNIPLVEDDAAIAAAASGAAAGNTIAPPSYTLSVRRPSSPNSAAAAAAAASVSPKRGTISPAATPSASSAAASQSRSRAASAARPGTFWVCPRCTLQNELKIERCTACENPRPPLQAATPPAAAAAVLQVAAVQPSAPVAVVPMVSPVAAVPQQRVVSPGAGASPMPLVSPGGPVVVQALPSPSPQAAIPATHINNMLLPPGWQAFIEPHTGRTFFANHQTRTTQWHSPVPLPGMQFQGQGQWK